MEFYFLYQLSTIVLNDKNLVLLYKSDCCNSNCKNFSLVTSSYSY